MSWSPHVVVPSPCNELQLHSAGSGKHGPEATLDWSLSNLLWNVVSSNSRSPLSKAAFFFPQWLHRNSLTWIHSSLLQPPASAGEGSSVRHHPPPSRSPVICATLSLLLLFIAQKHCLKQHIKTWLYPHWMTHTSYQRLCHFNLWALNSFLSLNQLLNQIYIIFTDMLAHKASQEEFGV